MIGRSAYRWAMCTGLTMALTLGWDSPERAPFAVDRASAAQASETDKGLPASSGVIRTVVQVGADISRQLDRLEKRESGGEIYDLFSRQRSSTGARAPVKTKPTEPEPLRSSTPTREPEQQEENVAEEARQDIQPAVNPQPPAPAPVQPPIPAVTAAPAPPPPPLPAPVLAPPPPAVAPPPPPPAPKPPALAFTYMGKLEEDGRAVYFLVKADKLYMVKAGEDIDDTYSFEGEFGNQLRLTYKPLRIAQTLTIGP